MFTTRQLAAIAEMLEQVDSFTIMTASAATRRRTVQLVNTLLDQMYDQADETAAAIVGELCENIAAELDA